jgi:hypothetical protein
MTKKKKHTPTARTVRKILQSSIFYEFFNLQKLNT